MTTDDERVDVGKLKQIVEGALMAADGPLSVERLLKLFRRGELDPAQGRQQISRALRELDEEAAGRGYELKRVASGFRFQVRAELSAWVGRLWEEKPPRYSRALLETLALIAYKQPVTRGDIEKVRGVSVSQSIVRTLLERGWVRVVGQRETPGRPNLYGTTPAFLDYFNLRRLDDLPPLSEIKAILDPEFAGESGESVENVASGRSGAAAAGSTEPLRLDVDEARNEPETGALHNDRSDGAVDPVDPVLLAEKMAAHLEAADSGAETADGRHRLAEVVRLPTARRRAEPARDESGSD